jgi:hypothetical protein
MGGAVAGGALAGEAVAGGAAGGHGAGRSWQMVPATSSTRIVNVNPLASSGMAAFDVASNICQALGHGHPSDGNDDAPSEFLDGGAAGADGPSAGAQAALAGLEDNNGDDDVDDDNAPSELLVPLLEEWPDLLGLVLAQLDPTGPARAGGKALAGGVGFFGLAARGERRGGAPQDRRLCWVRPNAGLGQRQRMPLVDVDLRTHRWGGEAGGAAVDAGSGLPVGPSGPRKPGGPGPGLLCTRR